MRIMFTINKPNLRDEHKPLYTRVNFMYTKRMCFF